VLKKEAATAGSKAAAAHAAMGPLRVSLASNEAALRGTEAQLSAEAERSAAAAADGAAARSEAEDLVRMSSLGDANELAG
jgi:hypothetical protein